MLAGLIVYGWVWSLGGLQSSLRSHFRISMSADRSVSYWDPGSLRLLAHCGYEGWRQVQGLFKEYRGISHQVPVPTGLMVDCGYNGLESSNRTLSESTV